MFRSRGAATTPKAFLCCLSVVFSIQQQVLEAIALPLILSTKKRIAGRIIAKSRGYTALEIAQYTMSVTAESRSTSIRLDFRIQTSFQAATLCKLESLDNRKSPFILGKAKKKIL